MEHPYKKLVDNIINDSEKDKLPRLLELARRCGNDNYILFRIAEYKFKYGTPGYEQDFFKLINDDKYTDGCNYYLGLINQKRSDHNSALDYFKRAVRKGSIYSVVAARQCLIEYFRLGNYEKAVSIYKQLAAYGKNTEETYNYAANAYLELFNHCYSNLKLEYCDEAINAIKNAILLNPSNDKYINFIKRIPIEKGNSESILRLINDIKDLESLPYKDELQLLIPQAMYKLRMAKYALSKIGSNEKNNISSVEQQLLSLKINSNINNDAAAQAIYDSIEDPEVIDYQSFRLLLEMYNKEGLFEKSYDIIDLIEYYKKCDDNLILYHQASTLIHQKRYAEAMCLLDEAIYNKKSNPKYNQKRDSKEISRFERLLALCMYLDGRLEGSEEVMQDLSFSNGHKIEIFLRKQLRMEDQFHDRENNVYFSLLHNIKDANTVSFECQEDGSVDYDENLEKEDQENENWQDWLVYKYIRNMLNSEKSMGKIESDDLRGLIRVIESGIRKLTPNYSLDSDTYLINLGQPRGIVNNVRTQFVIVETIPGGKLYNIKPVVPTESGKKNFRRLRS